MHTVTPVFRVTNFSQEGTRRASAAWSAARAQPSWVTRAVVVTFLVVIGIPFLILFMLAVLAAGIVFGILSLVSSLFGLRSRVGQRDDNEGRENVRVIRRPGQ